jgi:hypothetical protein
VCGEIPSGSKAKGATKGSTGTKGGTKTRKPTDESLRNEVKTDLDMKLESGKRHMLSPRLRLAFVFGTHMHDLLPLVKALDDLESIKAQYKKGGAKVSSTGAVRPAVRFVHVIIFCGGHLTDFLQSRGEVQ